MGESGAPIAVVIEDDADVRHLLRTILVRSGFEVVLTKDGPEGVEAVRAYEPVLTTLDVNMPGMDGFAAAKLIREFSATYIIMLTGLDDEIDVVQGLDSGADDYLVKPFRPRELRARIESVMRRPRHHVDVEGFEPAPNGVASTPPSATQDLPQQVQGRPAPTPAETPQYERPHQDVARHPAPASYPVQPPAPREPSYAEPSYPEQTYDRQPPAPSYPEGRYGDVPQQQAPYTDPGPRYQAAPQPMASPADPGPAYPTHPSPGAHAVSHAPAVHAGAPPPAQTGNDAWMRCNGLAVNVDTRTVTVDGRTVDLTRTEFDLVASLMATGRRVRSKADLVLTLRGQNYVTTYFVNEADKRAVEVHMANVRRKLGDSSTTPRWIETVRGVGYRMAEDA